METRVVEVALGLATVYLVLSLLVTHVNEVISAIVDRRADYLRRTLTWLLDPAGADTVFGNPLIKKLGVSNARPAYISATTFALVLLAEKDNLLNSASVSPDSKELIKSLAGPAGQILADAEGRVGQWFDDVMDRATGVYKRHTQIWIACFGALAVVLTNADTIRMTRTLWGQPSVRQAGVALAEKELASCTRDEKGISCPPTSMSEILKLELPLGWGDSEFEPKETGQRYLWRTLGWILSALAISLGAPFWFDLLKRIAPATRLTGPSPAPKRN